MIRSPLLIAVASLTLIACGGGGGENASSSTSTSSSSISSSFSSLSSSSSSPGSSSSSVSSSSSSSLSDASSSSSSLSTSSSSSSLSSSSSSSSSISFSSISSVSSSSLSSSSQTSSTSSSSSSANANANPIDLCEAISVVDDTSPRPVTELDKPWYLDTYTDPAFGTTIRRITDIEAQYPNGDANAVIKPMYNTVQAWNADESLLMLWQRGLGHRLFDGFTYAPIKNLDINPADIEQVFWDTLDPDTFYYVSRYYNTSNPGRELIRYHVSTDSKEVVTHFRNICPGTESATAGNDAQMMSWDSDTIGLRCGNRTVGMYTFTYRISTNTLGDVKYTATVDDAAFFAPQPAASGEVFYQEGVIRDANLNAVRELKLASGHEHSSLGTLPNGNDAYFATAFDALYSRDSNGNILRDSQGNHIILGCNVGALVAHDMTSGDCKVIVGPETGYPYTPSGTHPSGIAYKNPGWVALSSVGTDLNSNITLHQELYLAYTDFENPKVCRIGHHRSYARSGPHGYWAEPHPVISPSGTRILFASDWQGGNSVDTYVVELPSYEGVPVSAPVDTVAPQITNVQVTNLLPIEASLDWETSEVTLARFRWGTSTLNNTISIDTYATQHSVALTNLTPATTYQYAIEASDRAETPNTTVATGQFTTPPADVTAPTVPQNVSVVALSSSRLSLNWEASTDATRVTEYIVYRAGNEVGRTTTIAFSEGNLEANTTYEYRVAAVDMMGNVSGLSDAAAGTTKSGFSADSADLCEGVAVVNDTNPHPMTALAKPAPGATYTDPVFGTSVTRVTNADATGQGVIKTMYNTVSAWNADESRMVLWHRGDGHHLYNGQPPYEHIGKLTILRQSPELAVDIQPSDIEQLYWHFEDPDKLIYPSRTVGQTLLTETGTVRLNGAELIEYSVSTKTVRVLRDFTDHCGTGLLTAGNDAQNLSWDSDVIGLRCNNFAFNYRISTNTVTPMSGAPAAIAPQPFPSGVLAYHDGKVLDASLNEVLTLDLGSGTEHSSLGMLHNGNDAYYAVAFAPNPEGRCGTNVSNANYRGVGNLVVHDATDGSCRVLVGPENGYPYTVTGSHPSATSYRNPGWAVVSSVGSNMNGQGVLDQELFIANTDPSDLKVCRIAHHRSAARQGSIGYFAEPHPVLSPTGTRVLFSSDWNNSGGVDVYVVELPVHDSE